METFSGMNKRKDIGDLVRDDDVRREFGGVSLDTLERWDNDPNMGFPVKIPHGGRNYRSRVQLDEFKAKLITNAMETKKRKRA